MARWPSDVAWRAACSTALASVLAAALLPQAAWATLGGRPGQTELQSDTGEAVQTVCGFFARGETPVENDLQQDLFERCREMVQTANDLDGQEADFSLELSEEELAAGLQQIASEEAAAAGTVSFDTSFGQLSNLLTRLGNLRGGAGGLAVAGLGLGAGGPWPAHLAGSGTPTGGSAGIGDEGRLGFFVNGSLGFGDTDASDREDAFDFDTYALTAGLDYRLSDQAVLGAAVGYADLDADFDTSATVAGGDLEADGYSLSAYGTWYSGPFYVDGIVSYGSNDYDLTRRIVYQSNNPDLDNQDRRADSSTDSDQWLLSAGAGYDVQYGAATLTPYGRLTYLDAQVDGYTETGADGLDLEVESQDLESLRSVIGAQATVAITRSFGVLLPLARLEWHHEFEDGERTITARYVNDPNRIPLVARTDELDSDFFILGLGVSTVYKGGTQAFLTYETALGLKDVTSHAFTAGVRFAF